VRQRRRALLQQRGLAGHDQLNVRLAVDDDRFGRVVDIGT